MKTVVDGLKDEKTAGEFAETAAKKIEQSGKKEQIDDYIRKVLLKALGKDGYEKFKAEASKPDADAMECLKKFPVETQNQILEGFQKLEKVIPVGINDLRSEGVGEKITKAMSAVANLKDDENVNEDLVSGILAVLSSLWGIAQGALALFNAHPLAMTGICVLLYAFRGARKRRSNW